MAFVGVFGVWSIESGKWGGNELRAAQPGGATFLQRPAAYDIYARPFWPVALLVTCRVPLLTRKQCCRANPSLLPLSLPARSTARHLRIAGACCGGTPDRASRKSR